MFHILRFRNTDDVYNYKHALKEAKKGLMMAWEGLESGSKGMIAEGVEKSYKGIKEVCELTEEMEDRFTERRNDTYFRDSDTDWDDDGFRHNDRHSGSEEMNWRRMERRMRDSKGRFM